MTYFNNSLFHAFTVLRMFYSFFWVIPRRLDFMCRRFGTLCSNFKGRVNKKKILFTRPMEMELTECSETSAHKIHTPVNHPKERIQQNLIRRAVKPGLPEGTKGPIEAHYRVPFPVLHQCVYASYLYGCVYCALYWSNWIFVHVSIITQYRAGDKI